MALKLDRLNASSQIVEASRQASSWFQNLWQRTMQAIERQEAQQDQAIDDIQALQNQQEEIIAQLVVITGLLAGGALAGTGALDVDTDAYSDQIVLNFASIGEDGYWTLTAFGELPGDVTDIHLTPDPGMDYSTNFDFRVIERPHGGGAETEIASTIGSLGYTAVGNLFTISANINVTLIPSVNSGEVDIVIQARRSAPPDGYSWTGFVSKINATWTRSGA